MHFKWISVARAPKAPAEKQYPKSTGGTRKSRKWKIEFNTMQARRVHVYTRLRALTSTRLPQQLLICELCVFILKGWQEDERRVKFTFSLWQLYYRRLTCFLLFRFVCSACAYWEFPSACMVRCMSSGAVNFSTWALARSWVYFCSEMRETLSRIDKDKLSLPHCGIATSRRKNSALENFTGSEFYCACVWRQGQVIPI